MEKEHFNSFLSEEYPHKFNPEDYSLSTLFCHAAMEIDSHSNREKSDFRPVRRLGKILYMAFDKKEFRMEFECNPVLNHFLSDAVKNKIDKLDYQSIGLELIKLNNLSEEKQRELRNLCVSLSKGFRSYWAHNHPHGFKRYFP